MVRLAFVLASVLSLAACYGRTPATACALTCDQATPCPDDMFCGADSRCRPPGTPACSDVPDDAAADAPDPDMRDASILESCPSTYNITLASTAATSRYRAVTAQNVFWAIETDCRDDAVGLTHLVITETQTELDEVYVQIAAAVNLACWIGVVQDPAAGSAAAGWIRLDGAAADLTQFAVNEPNDNNGGGNNFKVGGFRCNSAQSRLIDNSGQEDGIALCECDGKAVSDTANNYMLNDPNRL